MILVHKKFRVLNIFGKKKLNIFGSEQCHLTNHPYDT